MFLEGQVNHSLGNRRLFSRLPLQPYDAAKAQVTSRRVERLRHPRRGAIAPAVIGRTKIRAALHHFARDRHWITRIDTRFAHAAARIGESCSNWRSPGHAPDTNRWSTPSNCRSCRIARNHWAGRNRLEVSQNIRSGRSFRVKFPMPGIGHRSASRHVLAAPGIFCAVNSAARRKLPFRLGRQRLPCPCCISFSIFEGDMYDGMILKPFDRALRTSCMAPIGTRNIGPPIVYIARINSLLRLLKHD